MCSCFLDLSYRKYQRYESLKDESSSHTQYSTHVLDTSQTFYLFHFVMIMSRDVYVLTFRKSCGWKIPKYQISELVYKLSDKNSDTKER